MRGCDHDSSEPAPLCPASDTPARNALPPVRLSLIFIERFFRATRQLRQFFCLRHCLLWFVDIFLVFLINFQDFHIPL